MWASSINLTRIQPVCWFPVPCSVIGICCLLISLMPPLFQLLSSGYVFTLVLLLPNEFLYPQIVALRRCWLFLVVHLHIIFVVVVEKLKELIGEISAFYSYFRLLCITYIVCLYWRIYSACINAYIIAIFAAEFIICSSHCLCVYLCLMCNIRPCCYQWYVSGWVCARSYFCNVEIF